MFKCSEVLKSIVTEEEMDIEELNSNELYIYLSSSESDTDLNDNDHADNSLNGATFKESVSQPYSSLVANIELYNNTFKTNDSLETQCATIDMEILEQNHNDPNNNLDLILTAQEQTKLFVSSQNDSCKTKAIKSLSNVLLNHNGILNSADNIELNILDENIKKEALQICILLPRFKYDHVLEVLYKNRHAENRIELSLWDLLPNKRPIIKLPSKRKIADNNSVKCEQIFLQDDLSIEQKGVKKNKKQINCIKQSSKESNSYDDIIILNDTSSSDSSSMQDTINVTSTKNNETILQATDKSNTLLENSAKEVQAGILHPAKLIVENKSSYIENVTSTNISILAPSKLTYVTAKQYKYNTNTETPRYSRRHKMNQSKTTAIPLGRNVFMSNSTDNSNNYQRQMLYNYMHYLNSMKNIEKQELFGTYKYFNINTQNETQEILLKSENTNKNILQSMNTKKVLEPLVDDLNDEKTRAISSVDSLFTNKLDTTTATNMQTSVQNTSPNMLPSFSDALSDVATNDLTITATKLEGVLQNTSSSITLENSEKDPNIRTTTIDSDPSLHQIIPSIIVTSSTKSSSEITVNTTTTNPKIVTSQDKSTMVVTSCSNSFTTKVLSTPASKSTNLLLTTQSVCIIDSKNSDNNNIAIAAASCKPSTSSEIYPVHNTEEVFGGTKKKEINGKKTVENKKDIKNKDIQQMYEKLILAFPELDKDYISQVCKEHSNEDVNSDKLFEELINIILWDIELHLVKRNAKKPYQKEIYDMDEQYTYLMGVFPNADPIYLKMVVAQAHDNPDILKYFVQTQWKHPSYPTKEERLKKIRITQQQIQYKNEFNVKQFLKVFPDPFTKFEDPNRKCKYSSDALEFLKSHFNQFEDTTLTNVYSHNKYHLTLTAQTLENMKSDRKSNHYTFLWDKNLSEDISLLQECTFIKYKKQIREYLDKLIEDETTEFEELKKRNELLECQCCYDECLPSKCSTCDDGHIFCNSCILNGTQVQLAQGNTHVSCFINCGGEFRLSTLQKVLPPTQFSIFIHKKQEAEVMAAGLEGLVSCPFCHFASIPPPEDKVFKCLNPECMKESCRLCKELNHLPLKCYEEKSDKARLFLEEKMTEALVHKCYNCGRPYFKEEGCNKITCTCGIIMCYLCDKPINGYDHFDKGKCPLWIKNSLVNTAAVQAVANETVKYIKQKDPSVKINVDDFLASLPNKSNYSHNQAISDRVNKITKFDT